MFTFLRHILAAAAVSAAATATAQNSILTVRGQSNIDRFGSRVAAAGDVDRDGHPDFIVGAPREDSQSRPLGPGFVQVYSGISGKLLFPTLLGRTNELFGKAVAGLGDIDGDGYADFAVGAPRANGDAGLVRVYHGKTGKPWRTHTGPASSWFGWAVRSAGDVNKDGTPDYIVGGQAKGGAWVFSGKDGRQLWRWTGPQGFGESVSGAGDINGDGNDDLLVGVRLRTGGYAHVYSGATGKLLCRVTGGAHLHFGMSVANCGDVNNDRVDDFVVGAHEMEGTANFPGQVFVFSGRDCKLLWSRTGKSKADEFGVSVAAAGDVDRDGHADVLVGAWQQPHSGAGYVQVLSGRTGKPLLEYKGNRPGDLLGAAVDFLGDINCDKHSDYIVGARQFSNTTFGPGYARIVSSVPLTLYTDTHCVPLKVGSTQNLFLSAGAKHANALYLLMGSMTGCHPGIPLPPVHLPLNFDPYTMFALLTIGHPPLFASFGWLDSNGKATARFQVIPQMPTSFKNVTLHHAFVLIRLGPPSPWIFASNAASLSFR